MRFKGKYKEIDGERNLSFILILNLGDRSTWTHRNDRVSIESGDLCFCE